MLFRVLATNSLAALALLMPVALYAQLPDAPSAVQARSVSPGGGSSVPGNLQLPQDRWLALRTAAEQVAHVRALASQAGAYSSSQCAAEPQQVARLNAPAGVQQPLYTPSRETLGPGPVSIVLPGASVPGPAPVLYNACPRESCSLAQSVMCCGRAPSPFARYLKNPDVVPITARDNLRSAIKDIIDPFNLLTIGADSAFGIATDSHTPYGPGAMGITKYAGVSMTEDLTGEFFGTFLVPSLVGQDPHYHREPFVSVPRRILHAVTQVVWTQSDSGTPMLNYANLVGGIATAIVSNTFVPGPGRQGFANTSERLAIAFATSPSGNLITEFVPDLASHINLHVVIFQRILNSVTVEEGGVQ